MDEKKLQILRSDEAKKFPLFSKLYRCIGPFSEPKFMEWAGGNFAIKQAETHLIATAKFGRDFNVLSPSPTVIGIASGDSFIGTVITPAWNCPLGKNDETISKCREIFTMYERDGRMESAGAFPDRYSQYRKKFSSAALKDFDETATAISNNL